MASTPREASAPRFQANLNFNAIMGKMEQNVKQLSSAFKISKKGALEGKKNKDANTSSAKFHTYFGDEELLNSLPSEYYQDGFDAVTDTLRKMPGDFNEAYLDKLIEEKESVLEVLNGRLFNRVMNSYGSFVQGMTQVGELSSNLQQSTIMCKNGRRNLQVVKDQLTRGGLIILSTLRRRQHLAFVVQDLLMVRSLLVYQQELQGILNRGDYPLTIAKLLEASKTVSICSRFLVVKELDRGLQGVYTTVTDKLDKALRDCCRSFSPESYEKVIGAYRLLGSTTRIAEKMEYNFVEPIESETKGIVVIHLLLSPENIPKAETFRKKSVKELVVDVKEEHFINCLLSVLEFMCDLMFSHYTMAKWHTERQGTEDAKGYFEISSAMGRFRKTMWDAMQKQVTLLLTSTNLVLFKVEHFIKVSDGVSQFVDIGEEFSSTVAITFKNLLKTLGKQYLENFHKQRTDGLRTMFENETWARCPVSPTYTVDEIAEFRQCITAPLPSPPSAQAAQSLPKSKLASFGNIVATGNPFSKMIQYQQQRRRVPASSSVSSTSLASTTKDDGSDDDEPAELRAEYVDEDFDGGAARSQRRRPSTEDKTSLLSTTAISTVHLLAKYIHLLRVTYTTLGSEVFVAIAQLAEFYFYTLYSFFGTPPPGSSASNDDIVQNMSPALRKLLSRMRDRYAPSTAPGVLLSAVSAVNELQSSSTKPNAINTPYDLVRIKWVAARLPAAQAAELVASKLGFGVMLRVVGIESIGFLAEAFHRARPVLERLVPTNVSDFFANFYAQIGLMPELRTQMYKSIAVAFLSTEPIVKSVDLVKWDTPMVKVETAEYVEKLLRELVQFGQRLDRAVTLPPKAKVAAWEAAVLRCVDVLIDAYAKIKKCTTEGRSNMLQDINAIQSGIESIAPIRGTVPGIQTALSFANGFFVPLEDLPDWAKDHPELALRHHVALVNINPVAATNKPKRQQVLAALEELDKSRKK